MKDQLTLFTTAKLAREKRFCGIVHDWYIIYPDKEPYLIDTEVHHLRVLNNIDANCIQAPTQSLLQKWLREIYNIHIELRYNMQNHPYYFLIIKSTNNKGTLYPQPNKNIDEYTKSSGINTYEEALEIGLVEALKLIKL